MSICKPPVGNRYSAVTLPQVGESKIASFVFASAHGLAPDPQIKGLSRKEKKFVPIKARVVVSKFSWENAMADLPQRTRVYQNHHLDSTRWNWFTPRDDDIIIATSYKAGTTLMQTIVGNLLFPDGKLPGPASFISPWLDFRIIPLELVFGQLEEQQHRRYIKTHTPLDGLPYYESAKYICVSRDPRDVFMSLLHHWESHTDEFYEAANNTPGRVGDPFPHFGGEIKSIWRDWITRNWFDWEIGGYPYWSHLSYSLTFWNYRHLPNILFVHYADMLADLRGEIGRIADHLEISARTVRRDWSVARAWLYRELSANAS